MKLTNRQIYFFLFVFTLLMLISSFILQYQFHLEPCSLCLLDRVLVAILVIFFAIVLWHNPQIRGSQIYSLIGFFLAVLGILISARHVWILHLPPEQAPACSPGLNYLLDTLPMKDVLTTILKGSGECAVNNALFLGLSLPAWTLLAFILLGVGTILSIVKSFTKKG